MGMANAFRIGIVGLQHDHLWSYLKGVRGAAGARITCAADPYAHLREKAARVAGIPAAGLYEDHFDMLEKEHLDACLIFAANARHAELTESCARRGLHVMVEKPIASDLRGADRMLDAAAKHGIRLMVNYPTSFQGFAVECHRQMTKGVLGRPWMLRFAAGHAGPEEFCSPEFLAWLLDPVKNGGGALQDFCTYGAALYAWYFGRPGRVSARAGTFVKKDRCKAEDHAVITVTSDSGAIGVLEGSWASRPGLKTFSLHGEAGAIFNSMAQPDRFLIVRKGAKEPQPLAIPSSKGWEDRVIPWFVKHIREKTPFEGMLDPPVARNAQEILDAAKRSIATGREVRLRG
jgi:predicted dehydrogenase